MEVLSPTTTFSKSKIFPLVKSHKTQSQNISINLKFPNSSKKTNLVNLSSSSTASYSSFIYCICFSTRTSETVTTTTTSTSLFSNSSHENRHWMVLMERPPVGINSKQEIIDYYVKTLQRVLGSEKDAQMCIYDASWDTHFGFCCDTDEETSSELARLPGVILVRRDPDFNSLERDYSSSNGEARNPSSLQSGTTTLFPAGNSKHWLVRMDKPGVGIVTKAQMVDYYAQILTKVLGNEKDSQMCIYHVSWKSNFGFCCELDAECARELAGIPGVLSVHPDNNFESENKDYGGNNLRKSLNGLNSTEANLAPPIKTKKLFITGLSFYTSEKTLRAAFEGFGELIEVKVIMDKISKRSKGYAFVEYTTEEAASAALKEMNGKIINGWMIVVDVAKSNPPKYSRGCPAA